MTGASPRGPDAAGGDATPQDPDAAAGGATPLDPPPGDIPHVPRWRRLARLVFLLVLLGTVTFALVDRWDQIGPRLAGVDPLRLALAALFAVLAAGLTGGIWRSILAGFGHPLTLGPAIQIFFVGQLGKYLPGSVWPLVTQTELARDQGVAPRTSFFSVALFMWTHLVTGGIVAALTLPAAGAAPWPVALFAPAGVALLVPRPLGAILGLLLRLLRRPPLPRAPDTRAMRGATAWAAATWLAYTAHLAVTLTAFDVPAAPLLAAGAFAAAWCAGFLFVIAPAGAGVRDLVLIALLSLAVPQSAAVTVALVSRLLLVVADLGWGLTGLGTGLRQRRHLRDTAPPAR